MLIFRLIFSRELYEWFPENIEHLSPIEYQEAFNEARHMLSASLVEQFGEEAVIKSKRLSPSEDRPNLLDIIIIDTSNMENVA